MGDPLIRVVFLGPDGDLQNLQDLKVTYHRSTCSISYDPDSGIAVPNGIDPNQNNDYKANILRRIFRGGVPPENYWKSGPPADSLLSWPARFPLTTLCRRLRKVQFTVTKDPLSSARLDFGQTDYAAEEVNLPSLLFDVHWCLAQMLLDRGPKTLGVGTAAQLLARRVADGDIFFVESTPFPQLLMDDVRVSENWMLEFREQLQALRIKVVAAQQAPADTALVHYVEDFPNSIPRPGTFDVDKFTTWTTSSGIWPFETTTGHWQFPDFSKGERSYDYCWALWRIEEVAYLLAIIEDHDFNLMIGVFFDIHIFDCVLLADTGPTS
ncbi:hypothetical protein LTR17_023236 [Elasticomyces elasticus]|nr:hypothetical protein LTR17_023236 [Elasticomyces elasticus]